MTSEFNEKQMQILQVTEKLFAEKGFDGTSIRDIAKQANINIAIRVSFNQDFRIFVVQKHAIKVFKRF